MKYDESCYNGYTSEPFVLRKGVRQGSALTSLLYILYIDDLLYLLYSVVIWRWWTSWHASPLSPKICKHRIHIILEDGDSVSILRRHVFLFSTTKLNNQKCSFTSEVETSPQKPVMYTLAPYNTANLRWMIEQRQHVVKGGKHPSDYTRIKWNHLVNFFLQQHEKKFIIPTVLYACELWNKMDVKHKNPIQATAFHCKEDPKWTQTVMQ